MPTTTEHNLSFAVEGADVRLTVTYKANFNQLERNLGGLGMSFQELITVMGVDPTQNTDLLTFSAVLPVTAGGGNQIIERNRSLLIPRAMLNEDPDFVFPDSDEIRCRIGIRHFGFPPPLVEGFTNQIVLSASGGTQQ